MKTALFKSLGLNVNLSVPSTVEEFDSLAKNSGACLIEAIRNVVYRGQLADFRSILLHGCDEIKDEATGEIKTHAIKGMDELYGIERLSEPVLDKDGKPKKDDKGVELTTYSESENKFFDRVVAEKNLQEPELQRLADRVANALVFDPSASERKPSAPKKLAVKYLEAGKTLLFGGKIDQFKQRVHKMLGDTFSPESVVLLGGEENVAKDAETLGWLVKRYMEEKEKQDVAKLVG